MPILFGHQCDTELQIGSGVVRFELERCAAFIDGGIEIAHAIEPLGQLQPVVSTVRRRQDCVAQLAQRHHGILLLERQEGGELVRIGRHRSRRGFGRWQGGLAR